jgi:NAD(P)H-dependent flavin oxidoreductase YrpB (nitropropane dioxygenase family)
MGVRISSAKLANATARLGALGVVSSVGLRHIIIDEVRAGIQETIDIVRTFPVSKYVDELLEYAPGGNKHRQPAPLDDPNPHKSELPKRLSTICAFVEVAKAKQGHDGMVGINVMWKCALTVLPSIYGAMLAGVDALLCGAGVPMELPDIVSKIRANEDLEYKPLHGTDTHIRLEISGDHSTTTLLKFQPPHLIPILSNFAFPKRIIDIWEREFAGARPFGFVLENHAAGGHNAPPRNKQSFSEQDEITSYFDKVKALGFPIFVAGIGSTRESFLKWTERGAYGMQVGSRFALCKESGMRDDLRNEIINQNLNNSKAVVTSPRMSSTGYPFKVLPVEGTLSEETVLEGRKRICNKGYLLKSHITTLEDGTEKETYICPAMPEKQYVKLGGLFEDTIGRGCLCNGLFATAGLGESHEPAVITLGAEGTSVTKSLSARQVIEDIMTPEYVAKMEKLLAPKTRSNSSFQQASDLVDDAAQTSYVESRAHVSAQ